MKTIRYCKFCNKTFAVSQATRKLCSFSCRIKLKRKRERDKKHLELSFREQVQPRLCKDCKVSIKDKYRNVVRCDACSKKRAKNLNFLFRQKPESKKRVNFRNRRRMQSPSYKSNVNAVKAFYKLFKVKRVTCNKILQYLPYSLPQLKAHMESFFNNANGFTWENYGSAWEVDHVIPKRLFVFTSWDSKAFRDCWALSNIRPLTPEQNRNWKTQIHAPTP